jgi:hypothetical protein
MAKNAFSRLFDYIDEGPGEAVSQWFDKHGDKIEQATQLIPTVMAGLGGSIVGGPFGGSVASNIADAVINRMFPHLKENSPEFNRFKSGLLKSSAFLTGAKKGYDFYQSRNPQQQVSGQIPQNQFEQSLNQMPQQQSQNNFIESLKNLPIEDKAKLAQAVPNLAQTLFAIGSVPFAARQNNQSIPEYLFDKKARFVPNYTPEEQERIDNIRKINQDQLAKLSGQYERLYPTDPVEDRYNKPVTFGLPSLGNLGDIGKSINDNPRLRSALGGLIGSGLGSLASGSNSGLASALGALSGGYLGNNLDQIRRKFNI